MFDRLKPTSPRITSTHKPIWICGLGLLLFIVLYQAFDFHYAFNRDTLRNSYIHSHIIKQQISSGSMPFWDQYDALGSRLLFGEPLDLVTIPLLYFLSERDYIVIAGFLYLFVGIYFMYIFLRNEGIAESISWVGATIWGFNGFFLWHLHEIYFHGSLIVIPLNLLFIKRIHDNVYPLSSWIMMTIANTFQLSTGRVDSVEFTAIIVLFYIIAVSGKQRVDSSALYNASKLYIIYLGSVIVAFFMLAPFTFSYWDTILQSSRSQLTPTNYLSGKDLLSILIPNFSRYGSYFYIPIILLPFIGIGFSSKHAIKYCAAALIILHLITAYPVGIWELVRQLPGHGAHFTVYRSIVFLYFGVTIIAIRGITEYCSEKGDKYNWVIYMGAAFVVLLGLGIGVKKYVMNGFPGLNHWHHFFALFLAFLSLCLMPSMRKRLSTHIFRAGLSGFLVLYICMFFSLFNIHDPSDGDLGAFERGFFESKTSDYVQVLQEKANDEPLDYRVLFGESFDPSIRPTLHALNSLESLNFFNTFPTRAIGTVSMNLLGASKCRNLLEKIPRQDKFYSLSSVKYFVTQENNRNGNTPDLVYAKAGIYIRENPEVLERIRFLDRHKMIPTVDEAIEFIKKTPLTWFKRNFIAEKPIVFNNNAGGINTPQYELISNEPGFFHIKVGSTKETMLILNNSHDKGWRLKVDGKTKPLHRVNAYFMGIKIYPGNHEYELKYLPPHFFQNIFISLVTMLVIAGTCRYIYLKKKKQPIIET